MKRGHVTDQDVLLYKDGGRPGMFEPHVAMFGDKFPFPEFCINEHVYRLRADSILTQEYLYFWMASNLTMYEMRVRGTGVAVPGLNSTAVRELPVIVPDQGSLSAFVEIAAPLVSKVFANCNESRMLAELRDTLLPRLISGELRVGEIDDASAF